MAEPGAPGFRLDPEPDDGGRRVVEIRVPSSSPPPRQEVLSRVDAPWFGGPGFYARVGLLGAFAVVLFSVIGLRLWSLQILHSAPFLKAAASQSTRTVLLPAPRGAIVDDRGRPLVETGAEPVVEADPSTLGAADAAGLWQPNRLGRRVLDELAGLARMRATTLVGRIRASFRSDPFAPAVVVPHAPAALTAFLAERARGYPGLSTTSLPT